MNRISNRMAMGKKKKCIMPKFKLLMRKITHVACIHVYCIATG